MPKPLRDGRLEALKERSLGRTAKVFLLRAKRERCRAALVPAIVISAGSNFLMAFCQRRAPLYA